MSPVPLWRPLKTDPSRYFDGEHVARAKAYQRPKQRMSLVRSLAMTATLVALVWAGLGPELAMGIEPWPLAVLVVLALTIFLIGVPTFPSEIWEIFAHDTAWGFNTQTWRGYMLDQIKGLIVFGILLPGIFFVPLWWFIRSVELWWLWGSVALSAISFFLLVVYPIVILPIFNKFTPLADDALRARLDELAARAGVKIGQFLVMDASKRSRQDNAFFIGLGATRRIVLYDTILTMPHECVEVVVAHEIGHWRRRHTLWIGVMTALEFPLLFGLTAAITSWDPVLDWAGVASLSEPGALPVFVLILGGLQTALGRVERWFSRWFERQADLDSLELTRAAPAYAEAWRQMVDRNLPDVDPSWWRRTRMTHPPIAERMAFGDRWAAQARAPAT